MKKGFVMKKYFYSLFILSILIYSCTLASDIYSLLPIPKVSYQKTGSFLLNSNVKIVVPDDNTTRNNSALSYLQKSIKQIFGDTLQIVPISNYQTGRAIFIGESGTFDQLKMLIKSSTTLVDQMTFPQGYIVDVSDSLVLIGGFDKDGTFNGATTIAQLLTKAGSNVSINNCNVFDYPDYPYRFVFSQHNLRGQNAMTQLGKILDTMAYRKLNGIQQGDFKYNILQDQPDYYFDSVKLFKTLCMDRSIGIIPGVMDIGWSQGLMVHDPNLAEGLPTSAVYVIENDTGRLIKDPNVSLPNGSFEDVNTNQKFTGFSYYDDGVITPDYTIHHGGSISAHGTNFDGSNCRFIKSLNCQPFRAYLLTAWIKTQNIQCDEIQLLAIGNNGQDSRALTFTALGIPSTSDWQKVEVVFNTLSFTNIYVYVGAWGATSGDIWFDDFQIQDYGLTNILRRRGTPLTVENKNSNDIYFEGIDFENVVDNIMLSQYGNFGPYHQPPTFKRITTGRINNGDSLIITSYHPFTAVSDNQGNGSTMVCLSEDTLYSILKDQIIRVNDLYGADKYFMGHDEIRNMNWDRSCLDRQLTPAQLLSDNMNKCQDIIKNVKSDATIFMWSDMVDSLHNAINNYYLVNGDLDGIWNDINKSVVIVNWNGGKAKQSLQWFSDQGFSQITSPYYDVPNTNNMRMWRYAQEGIAKILGMMYTTWSSDYNWLTPFAYYAWGAGPAIYHQPCDSSSIHNSTMLVSAKILPDKYDTQDYIKSATLKIQYNENNQIQTLTYPLNGDANNIYSCNADIPANKDFTYSIIAENNDGIRRETPYYSIKQSISSVEDINQELDNIIFTINPNIIQTDGNVDLLNFTPGNFTISIYDYLGNRIKVVYTGYFDSGRHHLEFNTSGMTNGTYFIHLSNSSQTRILKFEVLK
jgi:hypothetical protein